MLKAETKPKLPNSKTRLRFQLSIELSNVFLTLRLLLHRQKVEGPLSDQPME